MADQAQDTQAKVLQAIGKQVGELNYKVQEIERDADKFQDLVTQIDFKAIQTHLKDLDKRVADLEKKSKK